MSLQHSNIQILSLIPIVRVCNTVTGRTMCSWETGYKNFAGKKYWPGWQQV